MANRLNLAEESTQGEILAELRKMNAHIETIMERLGIVKDRTDKEEGHGITED